MAEAWRDYGVQPWRSESFRFSTDPELVVKVVDIIGLYMNPPEHAVVLCLDEKSQTQALDRAAPIVPLRKGIPEERSRDYIRHGTSTLFAALDTATGKVTGACKPRYRNTEFLAFLKQIARVYPDTELHLVTDDYGTVKRADVKAWLAKSPRVHVHFTPTHASWMNLVEVWSSMSECQAIHRGSFRSVPELSAKIRGYILGWNTRRHAFVWTETAD